MSQTDRDAFTVNGRKASRSIANGACVEVASASARVLVRDSVDPAGPAVVYGAEAWQGFVRATKLGRLDSLR